jgi:hypothetical protein
MKYLIRNINRAREKLRANLQPDWMLQSRPRRRDRRRDWSITSSRRRPALSLSATRRSSSGRIGRMSRVRTTSAMDRASRGEADARSRHRDLLERAYGSLDLVRFEVASRRQASWIVPGPSGSARNERDPPSTFFNGQIRICPSALIRRAAGEGRGAGRSRRESAPRPSWCPCCPPSSEARALARTGRRPRTAAPAISAWSWSAPKLTHVMGRSALAV